MPRGDDQNVTLHRTEADDEPGLFEDRYTLTITRRTAHGSNSQRVELTAFEYRLLADEVLRMEARR